MGMTTKISKTNRDRARGCLLGLFIGDNLGGLVEFLSAEAIASKHPEGVTEMQTGGGCWRIAAGQPTDDGELALSLAHSILVNDGYDPEMALTLYEQWLNSRPFDCGNTIRSGICGNLSYDSQANGALMRLGPLPVFGAFLADDVADLAAADACVTHPNLVCQVANRVFADGIAYAIREGVSRELVYTHMVAHAHRLLHDDGIEEAKVILDALVDGAGGCPEDASHLMGWVRHAVQIAAHELLHAEDFRSGVIHAVAQGGDTDTNGAITGMLLGACFGQSQIPGDWVETIANSQSTRESGTAHPRPHWLWSCQAIDLADRLLELGADLAGAMRCIETEQKEATPTQTIVGNGNIQIGGSVK